MNEPINILIVDDEPKNLVVLETVLDDPGYRLVRAESADQALLRLVGEEFALLILDIRMPGMSGIELAQMVKSRKRTARVPIIFLTAYYNEDQHVLEGYDSGAVDYLHKPVNPAVLRSKVKVFAELHRKGRETEAANRSLVAEVAERRRAEERLRELNETLEQRVTERAAALKANEALLRTVAEEAQVGLVLVDPHHRFLYANRAYARVVGLATDEVVGSPLADVLPDYAGIVRPFLERAFAGERVTQELTVPASVRSPTQRVYEVTYQPREREDDVVPGVIVVVFDLTERKRMEEALRDADRRKDEFLATLAHELRNPLAPVRNAVQLLKRGTLPDEAKWARDVIDRQTQQMARLIDDLLDVSRISYGKIDMRRAEVDLATILQSAVETSRPVIDQHGHTLAVTLPPEPLVLYADAVRLSQVFLNLLSNAAKYSDKPGRIELRAERQGSDVLVSVTDQGIGLSAEHLQSIFEMFSQVEGALNRSQGGLGIGLSLVKRLVELHGGRIEARSQGSGLGSEFIVRLPVVASKAGVDPVHERPDRSVAAGMRVLVVDDNLDAAETLSMLMSMVGADVRTAHDGEAALRAAAEYRPRVLLCDIGLPRLNGYEVCDRLRGEDWGKDVLMIALTGWGQAEDERRSKAAGFDHHLVKPVNPSLLLEILSKVVVAAP